MPVMVLLTPPIVRLSRASAAADGHYLPAELREPSKLKYLKLFLVYLHDNTCVCFEGNSKISIGIQVFRHIREISASSKN